MALRDSAIVKLYLILYNVAQTVGWTVILLRLSQHIVAGKPVDRAWNAVGEYLWLFQNAAVLEILHSMIGFVRSPVATTFIQVFSRVALTFVAAHVPEARASPMFSLMVFSWATTEVVRYLYYAWSLVATVPYFLLWLRYSLFLLLYPSGVVGEMGTLYSSLPYFDKYRPLSVYMPNWYNFAFDSYYALWFGLVVYLPGLPFMYMHMMGQRKRYLGGGSKPDAAPGPSRNGARDSGTVVESKRVESASSPVRNRPKRTGD